MFADVLVIALFRLIRRIFRIHQAKRWPQTSAALTDWTCIDSDEEYRRGWSGKLQIQGVFDYFVSGEKFVGLIKSVGLREASAWKYIDEVPKPVKVTVRYNPSDPSQYRVLQEDNETSLGFEVAIY
jgi:hypothetical protein